MTTGTGVDRDDVESDKGVSLVLLPDTRVLPLVLPTDTAPTLATLQTTCDADTVELVRPQPWFGVWCDEDGHPRGKPVNELAAVWAGQPLVGTVVATGIDGNRTTNLQPKQVATLLAALGGRADTTAVQEWTSS